MRISHVGVSLLMFGWAAAIAGGSELTPEETLGKQIYSSGTSPSGKDITAHMGIGGFPLPASAMPCASCHGPDGRGRPEGGVIPSNITWGHLTTGYGHQHSYGRVHPAFTEDTAARAVALGVDPAGNRLDLAMPVYKMENDDLEALIAYLKIIETDYDPGITQESIRIATLLPGSGRLASLGNAMSSVLQAYVAYLNLAGGINGRVIELEVIPFGDSPAQAIDNLHQALKAHEVFALLAPYSVGIEDELAGFAEQQHVPIIGPYTLQPPTRAALDRYTFYLFSGIEQQMRVLVDVAAEKFEGAEPKMMLVGADTENVHVLLDAVIKQCQTKEWQSPKSLYFVPGELNAERLAAEVQKVGAEVLFFLGTPTELDLVLKSFEDVDGVPTIFIPANLVTQTLLEAPAVFDGRIISAYPRSPSDVNDSGRRIYGGLREKNELSNEHASAQLAALAAGATFSEGLKLAGKNLSRESLIAALESLSDYETGFAPPLTFSLNRRIGALGAHVVRLDLEYGAFVPEGAWRALK